MSYDISDASERNFARAEESEAGLFESLGLFKCGCGALVEDSEIETVRYLHAGKDSMVLSTSKIKLCRSCAPRCILCDGLLDDASLFEDSFQRTQDEMNVGMGVMVVTSQGKMHGGCAAALTLGESDGEDLAMLSKDEISRRVA